MPRFSLCLLTALGVCLAGAVPAAANFPAGAPIDALIPKTSWSVELSPVATIPNSPSEPSAEPRLEDLVFGGAPGMAYAVDQRGYIYEFDPAAPNPSPSLFLNVNSGAPSFTDGPQKGLRGVAFHPDFNNPGTDGYQKLYTAHSRQSFSGQPSGNPKFFWSPFGAGLDHDSIVAEWTLGATGVTNYRELIYVGQPRNDHNIGRIAFNPLATPGSADYGKLYVALGDGGGPGDPSDLSQDISRSSDPQGNGNGFPHGSILRIDPIASGGDPFTIPSDNPFVGQPDTVEEVWAYGLRNPHKFGWDQLTGEMYIADIGQVNIEEVNLGAAGANYGWVEREGTYEVDDNNFAFVDDLPANHPTDPFTYPVIQYDHDPDSNEQIEGSWAIAGAEVYRGTAVPQLRGRLLLGDFGGNSGPIYAVGVDEVTQREDLTNVDGIADGYLAPIEEVRLTDGGVEKSLLQILRDQTGSSGLGRTDLRFATGPDGEVYVLNKHDGLIRRFTQVDGLLEGDFNEDGVVNAADYTVWRDTEGVRYTQADYGFWSGAYGDSLNGPSASVPEPTAAWLLALAGFGLGRRVTQRASRL